MQIDFNKTIANVKGEVIKKEDDKEVTLGSVAIDALLATFPDEQNLSGEDKVARFKLSMSIADHQEKNLVRETTAEEISLIKKLIAKGFNALVVGRTWELLEGAK